MDTARYAQQSDRTLNPHFRRRWVERFRLRPAAADEGTDTESALAAVARCRDEWRERRAALPEPPR